MFVFTRFRLQVAKEGTPISRVKKSSLPVDFFRCCSQHFGITFHSPLLIGVRSSQIRGIYLPEGHTIEANQPIVSIPLASIATNQRIMESKFALPSVTVTDVEKNIPLPEFKSMAPQLHLGVQFANIIHKLPDTTRLFTQEEQDASDALQVEELMPWARLLDDEDFNEQFVFQMFGASLDSWQKKSYNELVEGFGKVTSELQSSLQLPFSAAHLRRISRLVVARAEHFPEARYYNGSKWVRKLKRIVGSKPINEVAMVPVLDLINHSNRPNINVRVGPSLVNKGAGEITLFSMTKIQGGQELCRHYNFALSRPAALFRYGFLPFDMISMIEHSAVQEHLVHHRDLNPEADELLEKRKKEDSEIARLETLFKKAKSGRTN